MTLTDFLLARIAEERAEAQAAYDDLDHDGEGTGWATSGGYEHNYLSAPGYVFTRRWSPERALVDCDARRRIVYHERFGWAANTEPEDFIYNAEQMDNLLRQADTKVIRNLAAVYADHPDYDDEWRP